MPKPCPSKLSSSTAGGREPELGTTVAAAQAESLDESLEQRVERDPLELLLVDPGVDA